MRDFDAMGRKLTMDEPAAPAAAGGGSRDDDFSRLANEFNGRRRQMMSDQAIKPTGPVDPAAPVRANPEMAAAQQATSALTKLQPVGNVPAPNMMPPRSMTPAPRPMASSPSFGGLNLNPRAYQNATIAAAPRPAASVAKPVVPRRMQYVPPAVQQQITPFDAAGYLRNSPDIADSYAQYQSGALNDAARGWYENIARTNPEALTSAEAFAKWHYDNIGKNEAGRNPGGRVPGTPAGA